MAEEHQKVTFNIALWQPEIPANTGNIGRLCVGTGSALHIIRPCRFLLTDKEVKRAGLDYWPYLNLQMHDSLADMHLALPQSRTWYCTTKTSKRYTDAQFAPGDILLFGPESRGLPEDLLHQNAHNCLTIPMTGQIRSLNLANSVAIVLYEALRQTGFNAEFFAR